MIIALSALESLKEWGNSPVSTHDMRREVGIDDASMQIKLHSGFIPFSSGKSFFGQNRRSGRIQEQRISYYVISLVFLDVRLAFNNAPRLGYDLLACRTPPTKGDLFCLENHEHLAELQAALKLTFDIPRIWSSKRVRYF